MSEEFTGKTIADKYLVGEELPDSDPGRFYRGRHRQMEKGLLIKILPSELAAEREAVERFSAEARIVSRITHPNILNVTDFGTDENDVVYIVFEEAEGETLRQAMATEGLFPVERAVRIARQITSALSAAHSKRVIHGQLSSSSILLARTADEAEIVKVFGFGSAGREELSPAVSEDPTPDPVAAEFPEKEETVENVVYVAPENLDGATEGADERADIYSLGVILYEMLAGEVPFAGDDPAAILEKQEHDPPKPLTAFRDDLPEELEPIVLRALAKNPEMRYQTAAEMAADLMQIARDLDDDETLIVPAAAATAGGLSGPARINLWKTAFVVLAGISLLAAGLIYATSIRRAEPQTVLQADEQGVPVQPLNPATGINERNLTVISDDSVLEYVGNSNVPVPGFEQVDAGSGGDGYCAWCGNGPPPGAPTYPTGEVYTVPGDPNSQFMPRLDGEYILIEVPANTASDPRGNPGAKPTPAADQTPPANVAKPSPTPPKDSAGSPPPSATPAPPKEKPATKPTPAPTKKTPAPKQPDKKPAAVKNTESGNPVDS